MIAKASGLDGAAVDLIQRNFDRLSEHGCDLHAMTNDIMGLGISDLSRPQAGGLARWIANYSGGEADRQRQAKLGLKESRWQWSGACALPGHQDANLLRYDSQRGLKVAGNLTHPGRDPGCSCRAAPIIDFG